MPVALLALVFIILSSENRPILIVKLVCACEEFGYDLAGKFVGCPGFDYHTDWNAFAGSVIGGALGHAANAELFQAERGFAIEDQIQKLSKAGRGYTQDAYGRVRDNGPVTANSLAGSNVSNAQQAEAVAQTNITMDANGNANFGYLAADTVGGPPYVRLFDGSLPVLPLGEYVGTSEREAARAMDGEIDRISDSFDRLNNPSLLVRPGARVVSGAEGDIGYLSPTPMSQILEESLQQSLSLDWKLKYAPDQSRVGTIGPVPYNAFNDWLGGRIVNGFVGAPATDIADLWRLTLGDESKLHYNPLTNQYNERSAMQRYVDYVGFLLPTKEFAVGKAAIGEASIVAQEVRGTTEALASTVINSAERGLGSASGHTTAGNILEGGSPTKLAGHGELRPFSGDVIVQEGSSITIPRPNINIYELTGQYMEAGDWVGLMNAAKTNPRIARDIEGMTTHLPGSVVPNYTLMPPTESFTIMQNSTTVSTDTLLEDFLKSNQGCLVWAACTKFRL